MSPESAATDTRSPAEGANGKMDTLPKLLRQHYREHPDRVAMTVLSPLIHATTGRELNRLIERLRPRNRSADAFAAANQAGTTDEHHRRFQAMAAAGASRASVALTGDSGPERVREFGAVIERFQ